MYKICLQIIHGQFHLTNTLHTGTISYSQLLFLCKHSLFAVCYISHSLPRDHDLPTSWLFYTLYSFPPHFHSTSPPRAISTSSVPNCFHWSPVTTVRHSEQKSYSGRRVCVLVFSLCTLSHSWPTSACLWL